MSVMVLYTDALSGFLQVAIKVSVNGWICFTISKPKPRLHPVKNIDRANIFEIDYNTFYKNEGRIGLQL